MARRRRRRGVRGENAVLAVLAMLAGLVVITLAVDAVRAHPVAAAAIGVLVLAAAGAEVYRWQAGLRRLAAHELAVSVTDAMTGTQFEYFTARLMRASGFHRVRVVGGSGDMGADVIGYTSDGRRVVVQCKRFTGTLGSPHVQRFAGTARDIHRAEVALLVTTGHPSTQAREVALRCRITLVDRQALARWLSTQTLHC